MLIKMVLVMNVTIAKDLTILTRWTVIVMVLVMLVINVLADPLWLQCYVDADHINNALNENNLLIYFTALFVLSLL